MELAELIEQLGSKPPAKHIDWVNALIFGPPGAGKTWLAGTAEDSPHTSPVIWLDVEGGTVTIRHRETIEVVGVRSIEEIQRVGNMLEKNPGLFKTGVIDSLGEVQKLDMETIMRDAKKTARDSSKIDIDVPSPREWGKSQQHIRAIVRHFRDLPMNVIFTCHSQVKTDDDTGIDKTLPSLPGKLAAEISGFVDIVGYLEPKTIIKGKDRTIIRKLTLQSNGRILAKDRTNALGAEIENPTMPMLWELINGEN